MIPDVVLETAQAINALQLSMSYSTAVTELAMEAQETAVQALPQMLTEANLPPAPPLGQFIDTYA